MWNEGPLLSGFARRGRTLRTSMKDPGPAYERESSSHERRIVETFATNNAMKTYSHARIAAGSHP